jgi:NADH dehydrogenase
MNDIDSDRMAAPTAQQTNRKRVVIIGGGFAGLETARGLARAPVDVLVLDRANHHLFQPLLYQVATAALSPGEIAQPIRHILRRQANVTVALAEVTGVDTHHRRVLTASQPPIAYDILVIATGAAHSYFGHPEWQEHAPGLKTIDDALRLRSKVLLAFERAEHAADPEERRRLMTIAIVGGGPTGVELAGALAELVKGSFVREFRHVRPADARILLFEAAPRILGQFKPDLATYAERALQRLGVELLVDTRVSAVGSDGLTTSRGHFPAETIIWAAGVQASPAGRWLGVPTDRAGRIIANDDFTVPGLPDVYALGDTAAVPGPDGKPLPGLAQVAQQQGRHLGRELAAIIAANQTKPAPFRYHSRGDMATIGRNAAIAQFDSIRMRGFVAWILWGIVHVIALTGFENRVLVVLRWIWAYLTYGRSVRLVSAGALKEEARPE